ncbi:GNAT family N-acetyltransferase [Hyperthermus butylicus]|uniref:tRNA(Met) cytidine acetyltransferase TmcA n=1 Tax=Hyperthermus butylicus (strain DSM 5456 / JCM 9403 / PLM1-5) TaxID=415426 RepID=A2BKG0_HYPBU|nr:GNAT family N-acetyltransferase [Hyperthermus butylicus]ABM80471.1 putative P-loop ATPase fused to an acetyltransferase [Hyperthermus butylicus DSM 5456]
MKYSHPESLARFAVEIRNSGYRGLAVVHSNRLQWLLNTTAEVLDGNCIAVAPQSLAVPRRCRPGSPGGFERLLGSEADYVIIATDGLLRPNLVAGLAGVVSSGGMLVIMAPPLHEWNPGPSGGVGGYRRYLLSSLREARVLLWADADTGEVYAYQPPRGRAHEWLLGPRGYEPRFGAPRRLLGLAATPSQAEALDRFSLYLDAGYRSFLVTGDRGRGKSYLLGLAVALAVKRGAAGEAVAVAPSPASLASFYKGLIRGLRVLGLRYRIRRVGGDVVAVTGPWGRIAYAAPDDAKPTGLLVVDEAAAVGVARLRRLAWKSGRVLAATTIHGYEGSGRVFQHMVEDVLPKPLERVELREPIRYPPGDPLEDWVNRVFVLKPEPDYPAPASVDECRVEQLEPRSLAEQPEAVRRLVQLLALAHYRTEPDYLLVILESRNHILHALVCGGSLAAAADVALEEWGLEEPARIALKILWLQADSAAKELKAARIVRIAVHPELQRRGLGRKLLSAVEDWARGKGVDIVAALFGRHDVIGFWVKTGYTLFYVSPRYNKATGEKNLGFAKPLTPKGAEVLTNASRRARRKLVLGAHSTYRDLAAEKTAILLRATQPLHDAPIVLEQLDHKALNTYMEGVVELEQVIDSAYLATASALLAGCEDRLDDRSLVALVARILQGKPIGETAEILGASVEEAQALLREALKALIGCRRSRTQRRSP